MIDTFLDKFMPAATGFLDFLWIVLVFLIVLTVVVFIHEMGHFLVARYNKVRVDVFSIGFGKEIFGFNDRHGTRWRVAMLPLGGYVKFFGDEDASSGSADEQKLANMTDEEKAVCFQHKSVFQRMAIVAAGPLANFALAMVIFIGLFMFHGQQRPVPRIHDFMENAPAAAELKTGDLIVSINDEPVKTVQDVQRRVILSDGNPMNIGVNRDGKVLSFPVKPMIVDENDGVGNTVRLGRLGIRFAAGPADVVKLGPWEAIEQGAAQTWTLTVDTLKYVGQMITGYRSAKELGGPIRIARFSEKAAEGGVYSLLMFVALISANLGLINLFPIPMLDGGHLVFYTYEALRGRPMSERAQEWGLRFGLAVILALMIFTTINDLGLSRLLG